MSNIILDQASFEQQLDQIHQHFVTALSSRNFAKLQVESFQPISLAGNGQAEIERAIDLAKDNTAELTVQQQDNINGACEQYKLDSDYDFDKEIDSIFDESDRRYKEISDNNRNKMKELGAKYPEQRAEIVQVTREETNFWLDTYETFSNFINNFVEKVEEWIKNSVDWLKNAFNDVSNWASDTINKIGSFFGGIFSLAANA
ncbi:hypothetical protein [Azospirillum sp. B4]|uniref:hypothetical protein n=1 Tax=Azospirillum sp. B4 TaxID=95605 RepID=UPI0011DDC0CD|nr:hypothetical protein [Azospirillum sp. B4]